MIYIHNNKLLVFASILFLLAITIPLSVVLSQQTSRSQSAAQVGVETSLNLSVYLHGIGDSGDSLSPGNTKFSTKEPTFNKKNITINIYNSSNQLVLSRTESLNYKAKQGNYSGSIAIGNSLGAGKYYVKVTSPSYLWKMVKGAISIVPKADSKVPAVTLTAGDFNSDNVLDTLDYNILMGCYSDLLDAAFCDTDMQSKTDISADFDVNFLDYNLFLREIVIIQRGD